jgi:hypothetical protein
MKRNLARIAALPLALALFSGCSSFQQKWDAAGQPGAHAQATRWDGRWTSDLHRSGSGHPHGGRLRALIEPLDRGRKLARFHANWMVFASDYDVTLEPAGRRAGSGEYRGTHELPKAFGGTYRYDVRIVGNRFRGRYSSSYDEGMFEMTRQLTTPARIH